MTTIKESKQNKVHILSQVDGNWRQKERRERESGRSGERVEGGYKTFCSYDAGSIVLQNNLVQGRVLYECQTKGKAKLSYLFS